MQVNLRPELEQVVNDLVSSGQFQTPDDLLNRAVELLADHERFIAENLVSLRGEVAAGIAELDRGESDDWDPEEIKREGRQLLAARRRSGPDGPVRDAARG